MIPADSTRRCRCRIDNCSVICQIITVPPCIELRKKKRLKFLQEKKVIYNLKDLCDTYNNRSISKLIYTIFIWSVYLNSNQVPFIQNKIAIKDRSSSKVPPWHVIIIYGGYRRIQQTKEFWYLYHFTNSKFSDLYLYRNRDCSLPFKLTLEVDSTFYTFYYWSLQY